MMSLSVPLVPRVRGGPLRVLILGRVSTLGQNIENIDASYMDCERFLAQAYSGPTEIRHLGEQGSGLRTDRATIVEAEAEIATGTWDLVLLEDLSRAHRNPRFQYAFVQDAADRGTRVIAIGDQLDTANPDWEVLLGAATLRHGLYVPDTRRRVRRTATYSFHKGGMVQKVRCGYRKLSKDEAESGRFGPKGLRLVLLPECTFWIRQMCDWVLADIAYSEIARRLRESGVAPGPYVEAGWTGRLVEDLLRDPILSGTRTFRDTVYRQVFRTGKYVRVRNGDQAEREHCPELAHLAVEEQQELWAAMDLRAAGHGQKSGRESPLHGRPRGQALWPAQHATCAICGATMHRTQPGQLKCANAFAAGKAVCWNHLQVRTEEILNRVLPKVLTLLERFPGFLEAQVDAAWEELRKASGSEQRQEQRLDEQIAALEKKMARLTQALQLDGDLESVVRELGAVEKQLKKARQERTALDAGPQRPHAFRTREEVAANFRDAFLHVVRTSYDFHPLMRALVPRFIVQPVQALDTPQVRPRALLTVRASWKSDDGGHTETIDEELVVDLFESSAPIANAQRCRAAALADPEATLDQLGERLGLHRMTVKRALAYARLMEEAGTTDPYRPLVDRPAEASRWRRRKASDEKDDESQTTGQAEGSDDDTESSSAA